MVPTDVEQFTARLRNGGAIEIDRARRPATQLSFGKQQSNRAVVDLLLPMLSQPNAREILQRLEREARREREQERRRLHDEAIKVSGATQARVAALAQGRLRAAEGLTKRPPLFGAPEYHLITQPYLIWPVGLTLDLSAIVDKASFAKFRVIVDPDSSFFGSVRFLYYWTNPYAEVAVIDIDVLATWNGLNDVEVDGGLFSNDRIVVAVDAWLDVSALWDPTLVVGDIWNVFGAYLSDNSIFSSQLEIATAAHSGDDLHVGSIAVPPLRTVVFAAKFSVDCTVDGSGLGNFDYSSGEFQVGSPYALVTVLSRWPVIGPSS